MKAKAFFLSLLLHLTPLVAVALLVALFDAKKNTEPAAEAPIGDVFVTAQPEESHAPMPEPGTLNEPAPAHATLSASAAGIPEGEAEPLGRIEPTYPPLSRRLGEEGEAVFILTIGAQGKVSQALLEKSSGSRRLDKAAKEALLGASFRVPGRVNDAPFRKRFRVEFRLSPLFP